MAMAYALLIHIVSVVVWVGGMFLAYMAVRPSVAEVIAEPPLRLKLWTAIFTRFFKWVWVAIALILGSGFYMFGQMTAVPRDLMVMATIGIVMSAIFMHVYFAPFGRLKRAVAAEDWKAGGAALNQIRMLVAVNLVLGLVNICVAVLGAGGVF